jgi:aryl-alcohol dehydrogenase-like predicted oxidoreductase
VLAAHRSATSVVTSASPPRRDQTARRSRTCEAERRARAERKGCTVAQLTLAWVSARGEDIVPVLGARRVEQVTTMLERVTLSAEEVDELTALVPRGAVAGDRYPAAAMADLDSERR